MVTNNYIDNIGVFFNNKSVTDEMIKKYEELLVEVFAVELLDLHLDTKYTRFWNDRLSGALLYPADRGQK